MAYLLSANVVLEKLAKKNGFVLYTGREQDFQIERERIVGKDTIISSRREEKQLLATILHDTCNRDEETELNITMVKLHGTEVESLIKNFVDEMIATLHNGKKPPQQLLTQKNLYAWGDKYPSYDL